MIPVDPPPLATWILEHLTPADCDDALAGDLLEQFRAGRSPAWYWKQTVGACIASWSANLRSRVPLLVFAVLWSMLAPAWTVIVDRIEISAAAGHTWHMDFPFSELPRTGGWLLLNIAFLWTGILLFVISHAGYNRTFQRKRLFKSLALAAGLFLPIYFATFVVSNLVAWPGPVADRRSLSALGGLYSMAFWADILRIPYCLTLIFALWGTVLRTRRSLQVATGTFSTDSTEGQSYAAAPVVGRDSAARFFVFFIACGLMNAALVSFLLCDIPQSAIPSVGSLLRRAAFYMAAAILGGLGGAWLYWNSPASPFRRAAPVRFALFAAICASAWVWMPAMVLFYDQISWVAALVAAIAAACATPALKELLPSVVAAGERGSAELFPRNELFAESLYRHPAEMGGYVTAICLYLAGWAIAQRSNLAAAGLAGVAVAVAAWKLTVRHTEQAGQAEMMRRATVRLALIAAPAFLLTTWALMDGVGHREHAGAVEAGSVASTRKGNSAHGKATMASAGGYESVVLWPYPPKKEIVAPPPAAQDLLAPGSQRPVVIAFNGAYWYLQPPNKRPGKDAHRAFGSPVKLDIRSNNDLSMTMQARQQLQSPVLLSRCRAIEVDLENGDDHPGRIALAMLLENSRSKETAVYLGQQPVASTALDGFRTNDAPVRDTVRFAVPSAAKIHSFDRISVLILPDWDRTLTGPKIAIDGFRLFPR